MSKRTGALKSSNIELKSSFRYDTKLKQPNPKVLEKVIAKTVTAFMNAKGGILFIGVDDDGNILGLHDDYKTLRKQDPDGFQLELRQSIEKYTKDKIANENIEIKFHCIDGKDICEIDVAPGSKPVFIHDEAGKSEEFYVRTGNLSKPYSSRELFDYFSRRFR